MTGDLADPGVIETPALIVDLAAMRRNLDRLAARYRSTAVALRPHVKTHKSPVIAAEQLARGAAGVCAAKLSEAAVMVDAGIGDVLVTSGIVDRPRIERAVSLAQRAGGLRLVVDDADAVEALGTAAGRAGVTIGTVVDLDCGAHRAGIAMGPPAVDLAARVARHRSLRFDGFQAFASHLMHLDGYERRRAENLAMLDAVIATRELAERSGLEVATVTVGGTGTWDIDCDVAGVTEVQAGSYLFMDVMYRAIGGPNGPVFDDFEPALFVLTTVVSRPVAGQVTVDAGYKASATDHQAPEPWGVGPATYRFAGDEHGIVTGAPLDLGDRLLLLPGHCDPTVNLYDGYHVVEDGRLVARWPVAARGRSQ
ncbi:MAG: DSD1 family PLP-dependent enzyme [Gemmatimonadales bacterium]